MSVARLLVITVVLTGVVATQTAPRLMMAKDTLNLAGVGSPAISPDDQAVLYTRTVRDWDDAQWRQRTHIWRVKIDGTGARQLTFGNDNATAPAWFPDGGRIAFLSSRGQTTGSGGSGAPGAQPAAGEGGGNQIFF